MRTTSGAVLAAAAGALSFAALFFARGTALSPLVWIGGIALLAAAVAGAGVLAAMLPSPRLDAAGSVFLTAVFGLAVWVGLTTLWSASPESSWQYTNRTLVYAAFALLGVLAAALLRSPAETIASGAAAILAAVVGWALLAKCIPSLYSDYGRLARLRAPLDYWNELALVAAVAVPVALWLASRRRVAGTLLLYGAGLTVLLTYSRYGIALACLAAVAWIAFGDGRVESIASVALAGAGAAGLFAVALALPGITKDGQPHATRAHDGWIFLLAVLAGGIGVGALAAFLARRPVSDAVRARVDRAAKAGGIAAAAVVVVLAAVFASRIWHSFANPASSQISSSTSHLGSLSSSNRWTWWKEAWQAFTQHPGGGTGAGTFQLTDQLLRTSPIITTEPHNVPLQFLSETGIVGFLLFVAAAAGAVAAAVRARGAAAVALAIAVVVFFLHLVADTDWDYLATCGPLFFVAGALTVRGARPPSPVRRRLVAAAAVLCSLAAVYSLAAPWLAQRQLSNASTLAQVKKAHAYDPLSTDVLTEWAAFEPDPNRALQLYRDAVSLEPQNDATWTALGDFFWDYHRWTEAYLAYSQAWHDNKFGPMGIPCGRLDQARYKVLKVWPPSCPAGRPAATH